MPKEKRLSAAIDSELARHGSSGLEHLKSLDSVRKHYPKVAEAIEADAELRSMSAEQVLTKIARPYAEQRFGKPEKGKEPLKPQETTDDDKDEGEETTEEDDKA